MPHQKEAVDKLSSGKILYGLVGSGKSWVSLEYYRKYQSPKDIYIITTAKKRDSGDWIDDASKIALGSEITNHGRLVVDSWHNIKKYQDVVDSFFVFDEQRLVGSGAWVNAFQKIARGNEWIMLTATPGDTWMDYIPVFVANQFYRNPTAFKREHVVFEAFVRYPKVRRYLNERKLEEYRNSILVEMPYSKHTTRVHEDIYLEYDEELYKKILETRWNPWKDEPLTEPAALVHALRRVLNSHPSRLERLKELLLDIPKIVVFYNFNYELEILRSLGYSIPIAEWNGHKHQEIPSEDSWVYLVQYVSGAEGWNCTLTDTMVFWSMTYSYRNYEQAQGRIDRLNTPFDELFYWSFLTNSDFDTAIRRNLDQKKNFNESAWADENLGCLSEILRNDE